jgi:hypothetical protein
MAQTSLFQHLSDDHEPDLWRHLLAVPDPVVAALAGDDGLVSPGHKVNQHVGVRVFEETEAVAQHRGDFIWS